MNENMRSYRENLALCELTIQMDAEASWPPLAARYNVSLEDICAIIWEDQSCIHTSQVYSHIEVYIAAFVVTESLLDREIMDALMAVDKERAIRSCYRGYRKPISHMEGVDHDYFDRWLMALTRGWSETEQLAHHHLASIMYHWAWEERDIAKAEEALNGLASVISAFEGNKIQDPEAFPCSGFTHAVVRGFQRFQRPPIDKVLIHGTGIPTVHPPAQVLQT